MNTTPQWVFFDIKGKFNLSDPFSRHFGGDAEDGALVVKEGNCLTPELEGNTFSPVCEAVKERGYCGGLPSRAVYANEPLKSPKM